MHTNKFKQLISERNENYPKEERGYEIDGKKVSVTRHFTGNNDLNRIISELAISIANREMGV